MNRKASVFEFGRKTIFWPIALAAIVGIVIVFVFVLGGYEANLVSVPAKLKAELISLRFTNIPECFAYQDDTTQRVYSGIIDLEKFTPERLFACYHTEPEKGYDDFNFRLVLERQGVSLHTNNYFHKDDFTLFREVGIKQGNQVTEDRLLIYVQAKI